MLRDLQGLLRKKLGDGLVVDDFKTEKLLPPGENYASTIIKVEAVVRKNEKADKEVLHAIAKMAPPSAYGREMYQSPLAFRKEIGMYEHILEAYKQLELEFGFKEDKTFDIGPKYYGSRLSLDPNAEFDDDAAILLENLIVRGYSCGVRSVGYDLDKTKLILKSLARFHALGIALKWKKPEEFEKLKIFMKPVDLKLDGSMMNSLKSMVEKIATDSVIGKYASRIYALNFEDLFDTLMAEPEEPWGTIVHYDFWVNNVMLRVDENGKAVDVKFVDFQMYMYLSPMRDLIFFLFTSLDGDARKHIDELIDFYYESFLAVLARMECDVTKFPREVFDKHLMENARIELLHCLIMMKILTLDVEVDGEDKTNPSGILEYGGNELYMIRLREIMLCYVEKGWL